MTDQFDHGYRMLVVACKSDKRWFDLDAVRSEYKGPPGGGHGATSNASTQGDWREAGSARFSESKFTHPAGAPPLDYWLIDTQAGVDRVLKSMLPERVCKICGEPSRRITEQTNEEYAALRETVKARTVIDGSRLNGYDSRLTSQDAKDAYSSMHNGKVTAEYTTTGWTDCNHDNWRAGCVIDPFDLTTEGTNMGEARYIIGDVFDALATLPDNSVDLCFSSPPFMNLRSYLPADDPLKVKEIGTEADPADYLDVLLDVVEAVDRVLAPHGTLAWELGDTYSGSGGAGGDYAEDGLRDGQPMFRQVYDAARWPLPKSLCGIPTLFAWSLAYGRNLLRPERETPRWRIRNLIVWARPNPPVGALGDKFRPATSYLTVACKSDKRWFDLDSVRGEYKGPPGGGHGATSNASVQDNWREAGAARFSESKFTHDAGAPPLDYWEIPTHPFPGSHYATFPPALVVKPVASMCPKRVCRVCGEPSRRVILAPTELRERHPVFAATVRTARVVVGMTLRDVDAMFGFNGMASHWERAIAGPQSQPSYPTPEQWAVLRERLSIATDEFDGIIEGFRRWSDREVDPAYRDALDRTRAEGFYTSGGNDGMARSGVNGPSTTSQHRTLGWTDCGCRCGECSACADLPGDFEYIEPAGGLRPCEGKWRSGVVLDPFAGSGTTLAVATGHGRDAIGVDLDARNFELARQRVGPMFLPEPEFVGEPFQFPKVEDVQTDAEVL